MKRTLMLVVATAVCGLLLTSLAGASSRPTLALRKTSKGTILVNSRGFTVYAYTADRRDKDACARESGCLSLWPAVTSTGTPVLGHGVRSSLIGRTKVNGAEQVTYAGHPLYTYAGDTRAGQTSNINIFQFDGHWPAVNASGQEVK